MNALLNFTIIASSFGGELDLNWSYPERPENSKVYVFKRSKTDITALEITNYFANINDLSHFNYNGLMVFDGLDNNVVGFIDTKVLNDSVYYYKAVLRDEALGTLSPAVSAHATPKPDLKTNIKDTKEIVKVAIEKMFDNVYDSAGNNVKLGKDIQIVKNFAIEPVSTNYVMIERVNGSSQMQFWNSQLGNIGSSILKGNIDSDVIRATFITTESPERRDKVTNIFRAQKPFLIYMIKMLGVKEVTVNIEGDYYNPEIHGLNAVGVTVIFSMLIENMMKINYPAIDQIISEIKVME